MGDVPDTTLKGIMNLNVECIINVMIYMSFMN